jgi:CheY-like chemotaxis protein
MPSMPAAPSCKPYLIHVEDCADDAELVAACLRRAGIAAFLRRVDSEEALLAALDERAPDLLLCDFHLPGFCAGRALEILRARRPGVPAIVVSRDISEAEWASLAPYAPDARVNKGSLQELPAAVRNVLAKDAAGVARHGGSLTARCG